MNVAEIVKAAEEGAQKSVRANNTETEEVMQAVEEGVGFSQESTYEEPQDAPNLLTTKKAQEHAKIMGQDSPARHWGQSGTTLYNPLESDPAVEKKFGKKVYTEKEVAGGLNEHQKRIDALTEQVEQLTKILSGQGSKVAERNIEQIKKVVRRGTRKKTN